MTDKNLINALYDLFDKGEIRYEYLPDDVNLYLTSLYFNSLSYPEKEDMFGEAMARQNVLLFETVINVTSSISKKGTWLVGKKVIRALQSYLDRFLIDIFYEELENYNINEIMNRDNRFRELSDKDRDILSDNGDRL